MSPIDTCRHHQPVPLQSKYRGYWTLAVGAPEHRSRVCQTLNDAADTLGAFPFAFTPEQDAKISTTGRIPPSKLAAELRIYARVLDLASLIVADLRVRSLDDVSRLIFAAYVERVTGKEFHGPIAGIVAEVTGSDYTEDALKQVRYRSKSMLADPTSWAARTAAFLGDLADVLNART